MYIGIPRLSVLGSCWLCLILLGLVAFSAEGLGTSDLIAAYAPYAHRVKVVVGLHFHGEEISLELCPKSAIILR